MGNSIHPRIQCSGGKARLNRQANHPRIKCSGGVARPSIRAFREAPLEKVLYP